MWCGDGGKGGRGGRGRGGEKGEGGGGVGEGGGGVGERGEGGEGRGGGGMRGRQGVGAGEWGGRVRREALSEKAGETRETGGSPGPQADRGSGERGVETKLLWVSLGLPDEGPPRSAGVFTDEEPCGGFQLLPAARRLPCDREPNRPAPGLAPAETQREGERGGGEGKRWQ